MEPIVFRTRLTLEDFLRVSKHLTWWMLLKPVRLAIYGIALAFMGFSAVRTGNVLPLVLVVAVLLAVVTLIIIRVPMSLRKKYTENFRMREEIEFRIDNRTCRITGETYHLDLPWEQVIKVERWEKWYLLFITRYQAHIIRIEALGPSQDGAFERLLDQCKPGWRK